MEKIKEIIIEKPIAARKGKILIRHHHFRYSYRTTIKRHLATIVFVASAFAIIALLVLHFANPENSFNITQVSAGVIFTATINTLFRLFAAYVLAVIVSIPLALFIVSTPKIQRIFLPLADVVQSVPVLAFFPVVIVFFTNSRNFEAAALFIIFMAMMWNIVFTVIGGLQTIPEDVESAAIVFNVKGIKKILVYYSSRHFSFHCYGIPSGLGSGLDDCHCRRSTSYVYSQWDSQAGFAWDGQSASRL
jgi:ABC-type proline/glycine betaine transport system permease subunit